MKPIDKFDNIIIMGPPRVGKTNIANLIGEKLNLRVVSLDELMFKIYKIYNYNFQIEREIRLNGDLRRLFQYWKPFEIKAVEYALTNMNNSIIDFGAGHIIYDDPTFNLRLKRLLSNYSHSFYITHSSNVFDSFCEISQRFQISEQNEIKSLDYFFDLSYNEIANHILYTQNKSRFQIVDEIIAIYGKLHDFV